MRRMSLTVVAVALVMAALMAVMASSAFAMRVIPSCAGGVGLAHAPPQADTQLFARNPNC